MGSRVLPRLARRVELIASAIERRRQILALLVEYLATLAGRFGGAILSFTRALTQVLAGLVSCGRGVEQGHSCTGNCAGNERHDHASTIASLRHDALSSGSEQTDSYVQVLPRILLYFDDETSQLRDRSVHILIQLSILKQLPCGAVALLQSRHHLVDTVRK